jgi:hypothetical protein
MSDSTNLGSSAPDPSRPNPPPIREFNDRGTLWLLEDPLNLRDLLQILEPGLIERLDFDRAQRENRSFIPADLQKQESDAVFLVPFVRERGREVWIYVLLEHQSEPGPLMGLRLYLYMGQLWEAQWREWEDRRPPPEERRLRPIIPIVFYTGTKTWSTPIGLKQLMDLPAELERFAPAWETPLLDLHRTPPEMLTQFASAIGWALRVMQAEGAPLAELELVLREAMAGLEGLSDDQSGQWLRVAWFLVLLVLHRREEPHLAELLVDQARQSRFQEREEVSEMGLSVLEQAEARGETRATREALETVLTTRFGPLPERIRDAIAAADLDAMKVWLGRAANAPTLEEVEIVSGSPE